MANFSRHGREQSHSRDQPQNQSRHREPSELVESLSMDRGGAEKRHHEGVRCQERACPLAYAGDERLLIGQRGSARLLGDLLQGGHPSKR